MHYYLLDGACDALLLSQRAGTVMCTTTGKPFSIDHSSLVGTNALFAQACDALLYQPLRAPVPLSEIDTHWQHTTTLYAFPNSWCMCNASLLLSVMHHLPTSSDCNALPALQGIMHHLPMSSGCDALLALRDIMHYLPAFKVWVPPQYITCHDHALPALLAMVWVLLRPYDQYIRSYGILLLFTVIHLTYENRSVSSWKPHSFDTRGAKKKKTPTWRIK